MDQRKPSLFDPIVPADRFHPTFKDVKEWPGAEPGRLMADAVFDDFPDRDGNFVKDFQTTGFDSRIFELYLYAYLSSLDYEVSRKHDRPDFIVERDGVQVAIEATTVNRRQGESLRSIARSGSQPTPDRIVEMIRNELPIRFGSPLFSKLKMRYWELPQCKRLPIVFAIEAFHNEISLYFTSSQLSEYLYGLRQFPSWTESGRLLIEHQSIDEHRIGEKVIPSNFFGQHDTEYVSAVLFSNSGTFPKFGRMGYQAGLHRGNIKMIRVGACYNWDSDASTPKKFAYDLDDPPWPEPWGQGLLVIHNPQALHPLPPYFFRDAAIQFLRDGQIITESPDFLPFASTTQILLISDDERKSSLAKNPVVRSLLRSEFEALDPFRAPIAALMAQELEWFADSRGNVLGVLIRDKVDNDFLWVMLGRDEKARFRCVNVGKTFASREDARMNLIECIAGVHATGQTTFPQDT